MSRNNLSQNEPTKKKKNIRKSKIRKLTNILIKKKIIILYLNYCKLNINAIVLKINEWIAKRIKCNRNITNEKRNS